MPTVYAAADIGSNTAHLLVASMSANGIRRLDNQSEWLSLGQVVSHERTIPKTLVDKLVASLISFRSLAVAHKAKGLYLFGTEAVRRAENHEEVLRLIKKRTGLVVDVISPQREAELGLKGALLDCPIGGKFVFAETGGGSVQVGLCEGVSCLEETSLRIGTGVLTDRAELGQPPTPHQLSLVNDLLSDGLSAAPVGENLPILASGGVARGLWRALHPDGERVLRKFEIEYLCQATQLLNLVEIAARFGVKEKRAATLLPGSLIYLAMMERYQSEAIMVSQFGVREGAVLELSQGKIVPCPL